MYFATKTTKHKKYKEEHHSFSSIAAAVRGFIQQKRGRKNT